ncbi:MAG: BTAD domain-containing putative transcriptional regulator [Maricaulaceae bacterium]|jgi:DNA-binding SARP family transcriptional activator/TolB-like protein
MTQPRVQLLGGARLVREDGRTQARLGKKALALLTYLAVRPGREVPRETLAELLWPGRFEEQARQSLRQALSAIRRGLGEEHAAALVSTDAGVALNVEAIAVDIADFERLARSGDPDDLAAAGALYEGEFAPGLVRVSDDFDAWVETERRRLAARAVEIFDSLAKQTLEANDREAALAHARRAVEIEPAHEPGHRAVMTILAELGQRAAALRQFEVCREALARELDVAPDEETTALAERIRAAAAETVKSEAAPPPAETAPEAAAPEDETPAIEAADERIEEPAAVAPPPPPVAPPAQVTPLRVFMAAIRYVRRRRLFIGLAVVAIAAATYVYMLRALDARRPPDDEPGASGEQLAAVETEPEAEPALCAVAGRAASAEEPALVFVPFDALGDDPALAAFAAAATDAARATTSLVPGVSIVAGPPIGHADYDLTPSELTGRNGASHVLYGAVRSIGEGVQVTLRIVDGASDRQTWQQIERFDGVQALDAEAAGLVAITAARGVQEELTDGRQALAYRGYAPASLAVLEHGTRGYAHLNAATEVDIALARAAFEDALALDPNDVGAHSGLGFSYILPVMFGWSEDPAADLAQAAAYAEEARTRAPDFTWSITLDALLALFAGEHDRAVSLAEQAVWASGGGADATAFLAYIQSYAGDPAEARATAEQALRLRPYTAPPWYAWVYARTLRLSGEPATAAACLEADVLDPSGGAARIVELVQTRVALGQTDEARRLAGLLSGRGEAGFSAERFCASPPYRDDAAEEACVEALRTAEAP